MHNTCESSNRIEFKHLGRKNGRYYTSSKYFQYLIPSRGGVSGFLLLWWLLLLCSTTDTLFTHQFLILLYRSSYLVISMVKEPHSKAYPYYFIVSLIQNSKQNTLNNLFYFFNFSVCVYYDNEGPFSSLIFLPFPLILVFFPTLYCTFMFLTRNCDQHVQLMLSTRS